MIITQISLNGLDLVSDIYYFALSGLFDMEKDIITNDLLVDGQAFGRSKNKVKTLVLSGWVLTDDDADLISLNKILCSNGLKPLIINDTYLCYVEVASRIGNANNSRAITLQLTMPDPYLYALEPNSIELGAAYSSGISFTASTGISFTGTTGISFGASTGATGTITNDGNAIAYPVISIVGTCSAVTIQNTTTGESIDIDVSLDEGDTLIIDCTPQNRGVYLNGANAIGLKTSTGWITCPPGDNVFIFGRTSTEDKKHCNVSLKSRWI